MYIEQFSILKDIQLIFQTAIVLLKSDSTEARRVLFRSSQFGRLSMGKRIGVVLAGVLICLMMSGVVFLAAKLGRLSPEHHPIVVIRPAE